MKKLLALLVCSLMVFSLVGCSSSETEDSGDTTETTTYQMGVGQSTTISASDYSEDSESGSAQFNTTYALLVVDSEGTIVEVQIDVAQNTSTWDASGAVVTEGLQGTKKERGDDYNMASSSAIGLEWYEQVAAFEEYCVGKTVDEVLGMELEENSSGYMVSVDLTSSCTIDVTEFINAIADAAEHLQEVEGAASFGLASVTTVSTSDANEDANGSIQYSTTYAGVALDSDGVILLVDLDVAQNTAAFDNTGVVTSSTVIDSKQDRADQYSMASSSPIGLEWYEQAAAFEEYCVGLTVDEVSGMELTEDGAPADLTTSCTIDTTEFVEAIVKACE